MADFNKRTDGVDSVEKMNSHIHAHLPLITPPNAYHWKRWTCNQIDKFRTKHSQSQSEKHIRKLGSGSVDIIDDFDDGELICLLNK